MIDFNIILFIFVVLVNLSEQFVLDNAVQDLPEVFCHDDMVKMLFRTKRPFRGRIFVRGMVDKQQCVKSFSNNNASSINFELKNGDCNMRRQRKLSFPKGVEHSMTVVVSFHHKFLTQVDKAYRCTCFFMEADKMVSSQVDVSMIPTVDLLDTPKSPICSYTVRRGSLNGPLTSYANVGDKLWHVWKCDTDMFEMLVHSCFVDNGKSQVGQEVLDKKGCPVDLSILGLLTYNTRGNFAYVDVPAFKFPDESLVYYQCSISLCMKGEAACDVLSPPLCGNKDRTKRSINESNDLEKLQAMDLSTSITMLDLVEMPTSKSKLQTHTRAA